MKEIPVYLFTGFLDAGKTKLIQDTLADQEFNTGEPMLLIVCEEGEGEYDPTAFAHPNVTMVTVDDEQNLTPDRLSAFEKRYHPDRILIEYNGMWMLDSLYQGLPENWMIYQEIAVADSNTFASYNANMRQLVYDKLQSCETVIFNRASVNVDQESFHKIVRAVNRRCAIAYEMTDGNFVYDEIEDPLPFDINADVIEIGDEDYAVWYRDLTEDVSKYEGKTVKFKGIVARDHQLPAKTFVVGRHVMTCCADDITYCGLVCKSAKASSLNTRDWVVLTAKISYEYSSVYDSKGPVLTAVTVEKSEQPAQPVATMY